MSALAVLFERGGAPVAEARIAAMLERLRHCGPDRMAHRTLGSVALGHCTLETTCEDALDAQPLERSGRGLWIVADARLDNRDDLVDQRRSHGAPMGDVSDAELLMWAYERWGDACPQHLVGDFAFAIWDGRERRLFAARDPIGVRPLYYCADRDAFRCASEMQALFADARVPREPHRLSMGLFVTYQYNERAQTLWEGVFALPPGHSLVVTPESLRHEAYWWPDPTRRIRYATRAAYAEHFHDVFTEAVRCRLRSNRPVAGHVSGGLDSSSVASVAEKLRRDGRTGGAPLTLMRLAFPGLASDESTYSQCVADRLGLPIVTSLPAGDIELLRPNPSQSVRDLYFHPTIAMHAPMLKTALDRGIRTTLTGLGSDQLMHRTAGACAGYLRGFDVRDAVREAGLAARPASPAAWRRLASEGILPLLPARLGAAVRGLRGARAGSTGWAWLTASLARDVRAHVDAAGAGARRLDPDPTTRDLLETVCVSPEVSLTLARVGRYFAGFGAEERHPFLDVRMVELLVAFPPEERFDGDLVKPVLRRAMDGILPPLVRERRSGASFSPYVRACFFEPYWDELRAMFDDGRLEQAGIVSGAAVRRDFDRGPASCGYDAMNLVTLEMWLRQAMP